MQTSSGRINKSIFCPVHCPERMRAKNIPLPETLKTFVDRQVNQHDDGTHSEYVPQPIRKDLDRLQWREKLLTGASSTPTAPVSATYFDGLRDRVRQARLSTP
jgi:antitoxin ParD1/3/4